MKIAAAKAIASLITEDELTPDYIIPMPFDKRLVLQLRRLLQRLPEPQALPESNLLAA
jgi:malate dehydrogenase (oxaloacetate-decarboxylating)